MVSAFPSRRRKLPLRSFPASRGKGDGVIVTLKITMTSCPPASKYFRGRKQDSSRVKALGKGEMFRTDFYRLWSVG